MRAWPLPGFILAAAVFSACADDVPDCEAVCGNGLTECEETCDDGNTVSGDGCTDQCLIDLATCPDGDGDGQRHARCGGGDCDDTNPDVRAGAEEILCNGRDDDCDSSTPDVVDADGDGFGCNLDCDDTNPDVNPNATEIICNERDDDCDPTTADVVDADQDRFDCRQDCDERRADVNPDATEVCGNGLDDDCNGATDCQDLACAELPICRGRRGGAFGGAHSGRVTVLAFHRHTEQPVEGLEVLLEARGLIIGGETSTAGEALFSNVPLGPYTVTVRADGWRSVSIVGTRATRLEIPVESDTMALSAQDLQITNLSEDLEGRTGFFFASGAAPREVLVRRVGDELQVDRDPVTQGVESLSEMLPRGAPASMALRFDDDDAQTSHFAFISVKDVPEPALRAALAVEPIWSVSGTVEAEDFELVGGSVMVSAFVHAGVFGDLPGALLATRANIEGSSRASFGSGESPELRVVAPPDLLQVTLVARFERTFGFELARSERLLRIPAADLDQPVVFSGLRTPPAWLAIDQSTAGRPSFGWDTSSGPAEGEGIFELRLREADGTILRRIWVVGGADGVSLPLGAMLPSLQRLKLEVRGHVCPGLDVDDFRWADFERNTTHVLSRELELDL